MKWHSLDNLRATPFKEKLSDYFKDLRELKLLTNSDVRLTLSPGGVMNNV